MMIQGENDKVMAKKGSQMTHFSQPVKSLGMQALGVKKRNGSDKCDQEELRIPSEVFGGGILIVIADQHVQS